MRLSYVIAAALSLTTPGFAQENPLADGETWDMLRGDIVGDTVLQDGSDLFTVDAPYRANDAATVPVVIRQTDPSLQIEGVTVVIDENPAPLAATFAFGDAMGPIDFEMRVRVNQYSNVRVIADTADGAYMAGRFVKASGGCSAPASRDPQSALSTLGQMRLRQFAADTPAVNTPRREAQIMIRHPNYSGLQRDQVTQLFIGAQFIDTLEVRQGEDLLFTMEGGISISENPVFRFSYDDNGAAALTVRATDTDGNIFARTLPKSLDG